MCEVDSQPSLKERFQQCFKGLSYSSVLVALLAVGGAYVYFDRTSTLNKFSVAVTETLCDTMLSKTIEHDTPTTIEPTVATPTVAETKPTKESSHNPVPYDAKAAMQMRYEKLHDICNRYADVMRPESLMASVTPKMEAFQWQPIHNIAICTPSGMGQSAIKSLFERMRTADMHENLKMKALKDNFDGAQKHFKKAIMVRHPMERLLSVYRITYGRKNFAAYIDPSKGEVDEKSVTFADFVHLVVQGPKELADFISENKISGESLGIDTGMVDGKGESAKWDSYWHQCGLCNSEFRPHYILDFAHQNEDEAVLVELFGNDERALEWLKVKRTSMVSSEEVIKHFYSQLTKEDIRGIHEKYRVDFELFGYSPDYFLQFGQE